MQGSVRVRRLDWRPVGALVAAVGLLLATAQPASAATRSISVSRGFSIEGARNHLRTDARVTDPAPSSMLTLPVWLGPYEAGDIVTVALRQKGSTAGSRSVHLSGYGRFRDLNGANCSAHNEGGGVSAVNCDRPGFDWKAGRTYRTSIVRAGHNDAGWLWRVTLVDLETGASTRLASFRSDHGKLAGRQNGPGIDMTVDRCGAVSRMAAKVERPVASGSTVRWQEATRFADFCDGVTLKAPVRSGQLTLVISP